MKPDTQQALWKSATLNAQENKTGTSDTAQQVKGPGDPSVSTGHPIPSCLTSTHAHGTWTHTAVTNRIRRPSSASSTCWWLWSPGVLSCWSSPYSSGWAQQEDTAIGYKLSSFCLAVWGLSSNGGVKLSNNTTMTLLMYFFLYFTITFYFPK